MRTLHSFKLLPLALCFAAILPAAHADDASRKAKAAQMLEVTKAGPSMKEQLTNLRERVNGMAKQQFSDPSLSVSQKELVAQYLKDVNGVLASEVDWETLYPQIVQSYADSFTEPELDGIIAFYKTPAGQAVLTKTPDLVQKTNVLVTNHIKDMQPKLQTITQDYSTKIKAAGPATPAGGSGAAKPAAPATPQQ